MLYPSAQNTKPIPDAEFTGRIAEIHNLLEQYAVKGKLRSFDGIELSYYYYLCENPIGTMVIVHGFTEFAMKYEEIIFYFLEAGYNCFVYDQRSHGYSGSGISDHRYNHVEDFHEYGKDLNEFMEQIVRPNCGETEISVFCHSMGGAVSLLYFHDFKPGFIKKAVFSSPMIKPRMAKNFPFWLVKASVRKSVKEVGWNGAFAHTSHFNPHPEYNASHDASPARFHHNVALRTADEHYQNSGSTNRWLEQCMGIYRYMLKEDFLSEISQNILIFEAGKDTVVYTDIYKTLEKYLQNCSVSVYPNSKHSIYNSDDETLVRYWNEIFAFLKK